MDSPVSPKDEIWFLCLCHHISTGLYPRELSPWNISARSRNLANHLQLVPSYKWMEHCLHSKYMPFCLAKGHVYFFKLPERNAFFWRPRGCSKGPEDSSKFAPPDSAWFLLLFSVVVVSSFLQWPCGSARCFNYEFCKLSATVIMFGSAPIPFF